jgi:transposase-like protein
MRPQQIELGTGRGWQETRGEPRPCRNRVGARWWVDETYVKVAGRWRYVYRAVDQFGQVVDVFVSPQRDTRAAHRFFEHAIGTTKVTPVEVVTDQAPVYPGVLEELAPAAWHRTDQYANNRVAGPTSPPRSQDLLPPSSIVPERLRKFEKCRRVQPVNAT